MHSISRFNALAKTVESRRKFSKESMRVILARGWGITMGKGKGRGCGVEAGAFLLL